MNALQSFSADQKDASKATCQATCRATCRADRWPGVGFSGLLILFGLSLIIAGCKGGGQGLGSTGMPKLTPQPLQIAQSWHTTMEEAVQESASTGKPILVNFTGSDWCSWCVKLKNDVFETDTFGSWADSQVVLLSLDYPKRALQTAEVQQKNLEIAKRYQINGYPTVLFIDSQGNLIGKGPGYMADPESWIAQAEQVLSGG